MTRPEREAAVVKAAIAAKEPCRCGVFCIEDTERTGRYCKLKQSQAALHRTRGRK